jgi:hypothetical protein
VRRGIPAGPIRQVTALRESHADERQEHEAAIARLSAENDRLQNRIHAMYVDKLDGRIDKGFFEKTSSEWRSEQARCLREISWHRSADQSYLEEGVRLLDLAHSAQRLFAKQEPIEKRRLLNFVLSNSTWKNGELTAMYRQPFDLLAETTAIIASGGGNGALNSPRQPGWLMTQSRSDPSFRANRENNREFCRIWSFSAICVCAPETNSMTYQQNSLHSITGNFFR